MRSRRARNSRRRHRRQALRRRTDRWKELAKLAGLVACVTGAIVGQAELIGEPYRHYLTVTAIVSTAIVGYSMNHERVLRLIAFNFGKSK